MSAAIAVSPTGVLSVMAAPRLCTLCGEQIPHARIEATQGRATQCVSCLTNAGDVPKLKRFDEYRGEDMVSTYFTSNSRIEAAMYKLNQFAAPNAAYEQAVGDDSFLEREKPEQHPGAGSLADAFDNTEAEAA